MRIKVIKVVAFAIAVLLGGMQSEAANIRNVKLRVEAIIAKEEIGPVGFFEYEREGFGRIIGRGEIAAYHGAFLTDIAIGYGYPLKTSSTSNIAITGLLGIGGIGLDTYIGWYPSVIIAAKYEKWWEHFGLQVGPICRYMAATKLENTTTLGIETGITYRIPIAGRSGPKYGKQQ